jgi:hypothetical protein
MAPIRPRPDHIDIPSPSFAANGPATESPLLPPSENAWNGNGNGVHGNGSNGNGANGHGANGHGANGTVANGHGQPQPGDDTSAVSTSIQDRPLITPNPQPPAASPITRYDPPPLLTLGSEVFYEGIAHTMRLAMAPNLPPVTMGGPNFPYAPVNDHETTHNYMTPPGPLPRVGVPASALPPLPALHNSVHPATPGPRPPVPATAPTPRPAPQASIYSPSPSTAPNTPSQQDSTPAPTPRTTVVSSKPTSTTTTKTKTNHKLSLVDREERAIANMLTRFRNLVQLAAMQNDAGDSATQEVAAAQAFALEVESAALV